MSEAEVVDAVDPVVDAAECFGEYDESYTDCTEVCEIRDMCKKQTKLAPKPAMPVEPEETMVAEVEEMEPREYLVEVLKGRYKVRHGEKKGKGFMAQAFKDDELVVEVKITVSNKCLIKVLPTDVTVQLLDGLESCQQVMYIGKAFLVV